MILKRHEQQHQYIQLKTVFCTSTHARDTTIRRTYTRAIWTDEATTDKISFLSPTPKLQQQLISLVDARRYFILHCVTQSQSARSPLSALSDTLMITVQTAVLVTSGWLRYRTGLNGIAIGQCLNMIWKQSLLVGPDHQCNDRTRILHPCVHLHTVIRLECVKYMCHRHTQPQMMPLRVFIADPTLIIERPWTV